LTVRLAAFGTNNIVPARIFLSPHAKSQFVENAGHCGKVPVAVFRYLAKADQY
jgi:hypothetical protein